MNVNVSVASLNPKTVQAIQGLLVHTGWAKIRYTVYYILHSVYLLLAHFVVLVNWLI